MNTKYKLVTQDYKTRKGHSNEMSWEVGKTNVATGRGNMLCSSGVLHYYDSAEMAAVFNCIHAGLQNPRLLEVVGKSVASDGVKGGAKSLKVIREIPLPIINRNTLIRFAIYAGKTVSSSIIWDTWADDWLSGKDRTIQTAKKIYWSPLALASVLASPSPLALASVLASPSALALASVLASPSALARVGKKMDLTKLLKQAIKDEKEYQRANL